MNVTLVCEDSFDGIMTAIYDGWVLMNKGYNVGIYPGNEYEPDFFSEYIFTKTDMNKAYKVSESIRRKVSVEAHAMVYRATLHFDKKKGNVIFEFLKIAYPTGTKVVRMLNNSWVMELMELDRKVKNESHLFKGFVRFKELDGGVLYSSIRPKCNVVPLISHHFKNRFPLENWIIYDESRKIAAVHPKGRECIITNGKDFNESIENNYQRDNYEDLWKVFFNTIAIESRKNPRCQNTNIPKWYRENMVEFKK